VVIVPFQSFADSSRGGVVKRRAMCSEPMHLVESAALSGSRRLHSSMNFRS